MSAENCVSTSAFPACREKSLPSTWECTSEDLKTFQMQRNIARYWCKVIAVRKIKWAYINHGNAQRYFCVFSLSSSSHQYFSGQLLHTNQPKTDFNRISLALRKPPAPGCFHLSTGSPWLVPSSLTRYSWRVGFQVNLGARETWISVWISFTLGVWVILFCGNMIGVWGTGSCHESIEAGTHLCAPRVWRNPCCLWCVCHVENSWFFFPLSTLSLLGKAVKIPVSFDGIRTEGWNSKQPRNEFQPCLHLPHLDQKLPGDASPHAP